MSAAPHYPTDLSDEQWDLRQAILPPRAWHPGGRGRPPKVDMRQILNGILYLNKTSCQRRMMPKKSWPSDTILATGVRSMAISRTGDATVFGPA